MKNHEVIVSETKIPFPGDNDKPMPRRENRISIPSWLLPDDLGDMFERIQSMKRDLVIAQREFEAELRKRLTRKV